MLRTRIFLFALSHGLVSLLLVASPPGVAQAAALDGPDSALLRSYRQRLAAEGPSQVSAVIRDMRKQPHPAWGGVLHEALLRGARVMLLAQERLPALELRLKQLEVERAAAKASPSRVRKLEEEARSTTETLMEHRRDLQAAMRHESLLLNGIRSVCGHLTADQRGELAQDLVMLLGRLRKTEERATVLQALGAVPHPRSVLALMGVVRTTTEQADSVVLALQSLVSHADPASLPAAILALDHGDWRVRVEAVELVRVLHQRSSIPILIHRLEGAEGRLLDDLGQALNSLTGQEFSGGHRFWQRWWEDTRSRFVMPPKAAPAVAKDKDKGQGKADGGAAFYGIQTWSRQVVFVVDVSGSMAEPARAYGSSKSSTKVRKIDEARRNLKTAVMALHPDASFNVVLYSDRAWSAFPGVQKATQENKERAVAFAQATEPAGGTNIHDGLSRAFKLAVPVKRTGRGAEQEAQVDTVYFLSDGQATVGPVKDPDLILAEVDFQNRLRRVRIHAVGIGAHDKKFMKALAERNRGTYLAR